MPLLQNIPTNAAERRAQAAAQAPERVKGLANAQIQNIVRLSNNGIGFVWNNPLLTPQEVCDSIGQDAGELFNYQLALIAFIEAQVTALGGDPTTVGLEYPVNDFTIDPSGTVTIGTGSYQP